MATLEDRTRARLRQLRFERGLTVGALARAAGLATSTLSRLETGARHLSLAHVERLAGALGVAPEALLGAEADVGAAGRAEARDGRTWTPLADERPDGRRAYRVRVPVADGPLHLHSHEGHQWLYVLAGRLRLALETRELVLERDEAAELSTWRPHALAGIDGPAELLVLFDPAGEPLVVRSPPPA